MPIRSRSVEGRVAIVIGNSAVLGMGASDGLRVGDRFEIRKILDELMDSVTQEVLEVRTVKVGEFTAVTVLGGTAAGNYVGQTLSESYPEGYTARLIWQSPDENIQVRRKLIGR